MAEDPTEDANAVKLSITLEWRGLEVKQSVTCKPGQAVLVVVAMVRCLLGLIRGR